jgi:hypothetical protein
VSRPRAITAEERQSSKFSGSVHVALSVGELRALKEQLGCQALEAEFKHLREAIRVSLIQPKVTELPTSGIFQKRHKACVPLQDEVPTVGFLALPSSSVSEKKTSSSITGQSDAALDVHMQNNGLLIGDADEEEGSAEDFQYQ